MADKNVQDFAKKFFKGSGYRKIGEGSFAVVYGNTNSACKVLLTDDNKQTISYLKYCEKYYKNNIALPVVNYIVVNGMFTLIYMERLKRNYRYSRRDIINIYGDEWVYFGDCDINKHIKRCRDKNFLEVLKYLNRNSIKHVDIHDGNLMYRGRQFVVVDPVKF